MQALESNVKETIKWLVLELVSKVCSIDKIACFHEMFKYG